MSLFPHYSYYVDCHLHRVRACVLVSQSTELQSSGADKVFSGTKRLLSGKKVKENQKMYFEKLNKFFLVENIIHILKAVIQNIFTSRIISNFYQEHEIDLKYLPKSHGWDSKLEKWTFSTYLWNLETSLHFGH